MMVKKISTLTLTCRAVLNVAVYALDARHYTPHLPTDVYSPPSYPLAGVVMLSVIVSIAYLMAYAILSRDKVSTYPIRYAMFAAVAVFIYTAGFALMVAMHMPSYFAYAILGLCTLCVLIIVQGVAIAIWQVNR